MQLAFPSAPSPTLAIAGAEARYPIRRVYCVGRNYVEHAQEMGFTGREPPFFFMKPADAVVPVAAGEEVAIPYPSLTKDLHHEVELVVAIGKGGGDIPAAEALGHVFGYAVGLDLTRRDLQGEAKKLGRPWVIGKAFDQSAPIGPITPIDRSGELSAGPIRLTVNGNVRQSSDIAKLIWSVPEIIAHLSAAWTLAPGDLIMTGTPEGVAALTRGDRLEAECVGCVPIRLRVA
ncbi:MAG: fumarylacetoacetate hydrolase family protein [Anaerolineae bacterium]|nr:fumarylacetoacetate hydrolase family protein [Anaerolineae bacterium]